MRYPLKFLQRVGLVSTLLIGGVLGGLMAPLHSEASGISLTLSVDGGTPAPILSSTTSNCTTGTGSETAAGYTSCYSIKTGDAFTYTGTNGTSTRSYKILNGAAPARLLVADTKGKDLFALVSVQFVPVLSNWAATAGSVVENTDEIHTLTITMHNKFDDPINVGNAGDYLFAVRNAGEVKAGPITTTPCYTPGLSQSLKVKCTGIRDKVELSGKGTFSASLVNVDILSPADNNSPNTDTKFNNSLPLSFTAAGPAANQVLSWLGTSNATLGQVVNYPKFACAGGPNGEDSTRCIPDITQTLKATLYGPDTLSVVNGSHTYCQPCILSAQEKIKLAQDIARLKKILPVLKFIDSHIHQPTPRLTAFIDQIIAFLTASANPPPTDCEGETAMTAAVYNDVAPTAITLASDGSVPMVPGPPYGYDYIVINLPANTNWAAAQMAAHALGDGWDLATITSAAEQAFIESLLPSLTGPANFATNGNIIYEYWIGGEQNPLTVNPEPCGNWQWITGEGFSNSGGPSPCAAVDGRYSNWGYSLSFAQEPNNAGDFENHVALDNRYGWAWNDNDNNLSGVTLGYVAKRVTPPSGPVIP